MCENASILFIYLLLIGESLTYFFVLDTISSLMVVSQSTSKGEDNLVSCAELLIEAGGNVNDHDK